MFLLWLNRSNSFDSKLVLDDAYITLHRMEILCVKGLKISHELIKINTKILHVHYKGEFKYNLIIS